MVIGHFLRYLAIYESPQRAKQLHAKAQQAGVPAITTTGIYPGGCGLAHGCAGWLVRAAGARCAGWRMGAIWAGAYGPGSILFETQRSTSQRSTARQQSRPV